MTLASFLIYTRKRVERLKRTLDSIEWTANNADSYQVVIWVDVDDDETLDYVETLPAPRYKVLMGPRGRGYLDLHKFYNACAKESSGDFLFLVNDDTTIETQGWDDVLKRNLNDPPSVYVPVFDQQRNMFPIISRKVYDAMGHVSKSALSEFYVSTVAKKANIERSVEIDVKYEQTTTDEQYREMLVANAQTKHDDKDPDIIKDIDEAVTRVRALIAPVASEPVVKPRIGFVGSNKLIKGCAAALTTAGAEIVEPGENCDIILVVYTPDDFKTSLGALKDTLNVSYRIGLIKD